MHEGRSKKHVGNQYFDFIAKLRVLNVYNNKDDIVLSGNIRNYPHELEKLKVCYDEETDSELCFIFEDGAIFKFLPYNLQNYSNVHCVDIMWENLQAESPQDCYDIEYSYWYGIPTMQGAFWPLDPNRVSIDELPYIPYSDDTLGNILENLWLTSSGTAIIVPNPHIPIRVSFNSGRNKQLCLSVDQSFIKGWHQSTFNYSVCVGPNIQETYTALRNELLPPSPPLQANSYPLANILWQYQNRYANSNSLSLDTFGDFLHKLNSYGIPVHLVQYNGQWENHPGDFKFNTLTRNMLSHFFKGKYSNTELILPVNLACSYLSENFVKGERQQLFVKDIQTGAMKAIVYNGESCALWDTTNPQTINFLKDAMAVLQQTGTLEQTAYPHGFNLHTTIHYKAFPVTLSRNTSDVNAINKDFVDFLLSLNKTIIMKTVYHMQNRSVFGEIPTLVSNIDGRKCLDYIIPAVLTAAIHGYPFVVAGAPSEEQVDSELFLRWLQLAVFMPGLKVPNAVLVFPDITSQILKNLSDLRQNEVVPILLDALQDVRQGAPIIRPLWWSNPNDFTTFTISDEFLIGDSVLVAPVLCHGQRSRDVYLPEGDWRHNATGTVYTGGQWLRNFEVPLLETAVFLLYSTNVTST